MAIKQNAFNTVYTFGEFERVFNIPLTTCKQEKRRGQFPRQCPYMPGNKSKCIKATENGQKKLKLFRPLEWPYDEYYMLESAVPQFDKVAVDADKLFLTGINVSKYRYNRKSKKMIALPKNGRYPLKYYSANSISTFFSELQQWMDFLGEFSDSDKRSYVKKCPVFLKHKL